MNYFLILLAVTTLVLWLPYPKISLLKKVMSTATIAFAIALPATGLISQLLTMSTYEPVSIVVTATGQKSDQSEGTEVWIQGVSVDGKWFHAKDIFDKKAQWIEKDGALGWRDYEQPNGLASSINGTLPNGKQRSIVFDTNKWRGIVKYELNGSTKIEDLFVPTDNTTDKSFGIEHSENQSKKISGNQRILIFAVSFFISISIIALMFYFDGRRNKNGNISTPIEKEAHLIWPDLLRILCIFAVVWIHTSSNVYNNFTNNMSTWYWYLYINAATCFAVPVFYMLSGAFLIGKRESIHSVVTKRIKRIVIPLFVWSFIYILLRKYSLHEDVNILSASVRMLFSSQYSHLWFMYPLLGLYFLLPLIRKAYYEWDTNLKKYAFLLIIIIPLLLTTIIGYTTKTVPLPSFAFGFPELGIFIIGKLIIDNKHKLLGKVWLAWITVFIGFSGVVLSSYYLSLKIGYPDKTFLGGYGTVPVFIFATSVFVLLMLLEDKLQKISLVLKNWIMSLSKLTMGIYYVHMLAIYYVGNRKLGIISFTNNADGSINMFLGALMYFVFSAMFVFVLSKIPFFKKLV
ncbi:acyltransferase [Paenibacillus hemerocallicola]|uniref:Acyltransferase n=1 Tax=Paenibacillus hemerocallicola TaxID=1172614 RepID=A0A5C4SX16_9BACL|nr:acyltransferase [Paenibacillus hemerocallicola]TNJ59764.1 acyltransferase [Paenibacillus hemerocallicola]